MITGATVLWKFKAFVIVYDDKNNPQNVLSEFLIDRDHIVGMIRSPDGSFEIINKNGRTYSLPEKEGKDYWDNLKAAEENQSGGY